MVLGIRFPKTFEFSQSPNPSAPPEEPVMDFQAISGTTFSAGNVGTWLPIAPFRYSQVRKVVFWANVRSEQVSTTMRLRISILPTVLGNKTPFDINMPPSSVTRVGVSPNGPFPTLSFNQGDLFNKNGISASVPQSSDVLDGATTMLRIEFDRFQADSADFFAVWDQADDADHYWGFRFNLQRTDGVNWPNNTDNCQAANIGCTIIQAPSPNNKSCTIMSITPGSIVSSQMATAFPAGYRGHFFRYVASEWDNITSATILGNSFNQTDTSRIWRMGLFKVATLEPATFTQLYTEDFTDNTFTRSVGDRTWFRSADIKHLLEDGAFHQILWDNLTGQALTNPVAFIEITQEGFTNTVCHHPAGNGQRDDLSSGGLYGSPACGLFDPNWYQSFPDERIIGRRIYLGFRHDNAVTGTTVGLFADANMASDITQLSNTSPSLANITPRLSSTPSATVGLKERFDTTFDPNLINIAGIRKLVWGITTPSLSEEDFDGDGGFYYVLSVPTSEIPEVGNIFPIDAFNPEGCASTAAGLGDPGVLVITNGSTVPKKFNPLASVVEDAGVPAPFCNEPLPTFTIDDTAASPNGGLQPGIYRYRYTFRNCCTGKESDPNGEDLVVDTTGASPAALVTLNFTGIRIPGDPQICEICVYRTVLDGAFPVMAKVGCFDPDVQSTFVDDLSDQALDFENDPLSTLNAPPPCTPIVVEFRNRLAFMGDIPELSPAGTVSVEQGSNIVTGSFDVEWNRCLEGKYIQLEGDCRPYEILCVMPPEDGTSPPIQRLQLVEEYEGESRLDVHYTICGHPNRVWFSEPVEPEYVPLSNFIEVEPGDGDRIMGGVSNFDSLVICKRRKTYVMRWREDPVLEVIVPSRVSSDIGCIAPRSFAQIESGSVWLSDRGLCMYDGRGVQMIPESANFDSFFTDPENPNYVRRDNLGRVLGAVGVFYPKRKQYLLLLPTIQTDRGANLLMVWDTLLRNITVHVFCQEFLSMTVGKDSDGNERVYLGDANGFVWILDVGHTDGVGFPNATGTVEGTITAAGIDPSLGVSFIEDSNASFITGGLPGLAGLSGVAGLSAAFAGDDLGLAGVCVFFRPAGSASDDDWEERTVFASTSQRLFVTPPLPVGSELAGYEYMLGPIDFLAKWKPTNYGDDDVQKRNWRTVIVHEPEDVSSEVEVEFRPDFQNSDPDDGAVVDEQGVAGKLKFDMNFSKGRQVAPVGRNLYDFEQIVVSNFGPNRPVRLINLGLGVAPHMSK
jgi:hypothetical protein